MLGPQGIWMVVGVITLLLVVVWYWGLRLPLVIYRTQRFNPAPTLQRFDLIETPPPGEAGRYFRSMDRQLKTLDFYQLDSLALPDPLPNVRALILIYCNDMTQDLATATMMYGIDVNTETVNLASSYVEFISCFDCEAPRIIQTNNAQMLGSFPQSRDVRTYRFPHVSKLERLFDLHCRILERDNPPGRKYFRLDREFQGGCAAYLKAAMLEAYEKQLATGYLTRDSENSSFRPTFIGALMMTWAQQSPLKEFLWNQVQTRALQLERELL